MTTFPKPLPRHKPFKCCTAWHLRKSGALLSIYDLLGGLTNGGETKFFSSIAHVTRYFYPEVADNADAFGSKYEITRKNFAVLRKLGWLKMCENGDHEYVSHDAWAKAHKGACNERELLPWQIETDPLVGKLFAISGGRLKLMENYVVGLRRVATDEELIEAYTKAMAKAEQMREQGLYSGTSPRKMMQAVYNEFKKRGRKPNIQNGTHPNIQNGTNPT